MLRPSRHVSRSVLRCWGPGLIAAAGAAGVALAAKSVVPWVSPLIIAALLGLLLANSTAAPSRLRPGLEFAATPLLRVGVVLLGLRVSIGDVAALGAPTLAVVAATVALTFFGTQWLGARLGVSPDASLLIGTGFAICGASAIAAVKSSTDARPEDVTVAIGLVTVCGSLAVAVLPLLAGPLGLGAGAFGVWAGASVHDVAQVVATASTHGEVALSSAVVVKLTRVALLGPILAGINLRQPQVPGSRRTFRLLPGFVLAFGAMVLLRSTDVAPEALLDAASVLEMALLTAALVGLGSRVVLRDLRSIGPRPFVLGMLSWLTVGGVSFVGVLLTR